MNILFFINSLGGGGAERVVCNLANYLSDKVEKVSILTFYKSQGVYELNDNINVDYLIKRKLKGPKETVVVAFKFVGYLRKNKTDCVISMLIKPVCLSLLLKKWINAKVVISERNDPASYPGKAQKILAGYINKADGVIFQTKDAQEWYLSRSIIKDSIVIPNAVNDAVINYNSSGQATEVKEMFRIVAVGRLEKQKNYKLLFDALELVYERGYTKIVIDIYGKGSQERELKEYASKLRVNQCVTFKGFSDSISKSISDASAFVMSSDYEGMPNALIEAMALGIPCISTDCPCGGPKEIIKAGENGLLVPVRDPYKLAEAIIYLIDNPDEAKWLANNAIKIRETHSSTRINGIWEKYLRHIISDS